MTKERQIEILMMDRCTKAEAEKYVNNNRVTIYEDFEENFDQYMDELVLCAGFGKFGKEEAEEEITNYRKMIDTKRPLTDWGVVEDAGKTYYIM